MAQVKITQLSAIPSITGSEVFPVVQNGTTLQATILQVQNSLGIYNGTGSPTVTATNGSIYLRNDTSAAPSLYVRVGNVWIAKG